MKRLIQPIFFLLVLTVYTQDLDLPPDFRQHTLTDYNSSFQNPVFSLSRNQPQSIALWTRWQWQNIDADPSTLFLNYSRRLNKESAGGAALFQHNTSFYVQRGVAFNYAFGLDLKDNAQIAFGVNLFAYQQQLSDQDLLLIPNPPVPLRDSNDFILQLAPGLLFKVGQFSTGIAVENLVDYNISAGEKVTQPGEKIYFGHASFDFPIVVFGTGEISFVRPVLYLKSIPGYDNQLGMNTILSTSKFYTQLGYNNFYGFSAGLGGRFLQKFSIGALMEFGTRSELNGFDPSIEIALSYFIGPQFQEEEEMPEEEEPEEIQEEITAEEEKELQQAAEAELAQRLEEEKQMEEARIARENFVRDSIEMVRLAEIEAARRIREALVKDSLEAVKRAEADAARKQAEMQKLAEAEAAEPEEGEKYQEATSEEGLQPGYYLVANVFGTKKYYEAFIKTLSQQGLEPKSFYRSSNKYNYVYLKRYDSMQQARQARDSQYNGRYKGETWIFRILPQ